MSGTTTTVGATLTNPEALETVADLREALHQANERALQMGGRLDMTESAMVVLGRDMRALLVLHMEGNPVGVYEQLDAKVKKYVRSMPKGTGLGSATVH